MRHLPALAILALAGCAAGATPARVARGDAAACVQAFQWYDTVKASMSTPSGPDDRMAIPPALQMPVAGIQSLGCLTFSDDLAPMATATRPPVASGGPAIPPTSIHAGVVTNMADEANVLAFFEAHGAGARSIGAAVDDRERREALGESLQAVEVFRRGQAAVHAKGREQARNLPRLRDAEVLVEARNPIVPDDRIVAREKFAADRRVGRAAGGAGAGGGKEGEGGEPAAHGQNLLVG